MEHQGKSSGGVKNKKRKIILSEAISSVAAMRKTTFQQCHDHHLRESVDCLHDSVTILILIVTTQAAVKFCVDFVVQVN